jgi:flagellar basal-body rod protein FlgB
MTSARSAYRSPGLGAREGRAISGTMAISGISIFSLLRAKMHWHQERQRLLAENIANADTPGFRARDLAPFKADPRTTSAASIVLLRTDPAHAAGFDVQTSRFPVDQRSNYEVRPTGNAVNLENEMLKLGSNQMDYQTVTSLYARSLGLIKAALGKH